MEKLSTNLSGNMEGFQQEKEDYSKFEPSFRRWLVSELDSGRMSIAEAREAFKLPRRFDMTYKHSGKRNIPTKSTYLCSQ